MTDHRDLHSEALATATAWVERVDGTGLARPTPCAGWDLGDLLAHMVGQHRGFAAAVRAGTAPASAYHPVPFTSSAWTCSVDDLVEAFAAAPADATIIEVELHPTRPLPLAVVVDAQLLDTVVHTWDIATSLQATFHPGAETAELMLAMATRIPDDDRRDAPGAAFAHAVQDAGGDPWERALALLGRGQGVSG